MNPNVLLVPLDELKGGNEHEIFLQGDPFRRRVFRLHIGRVMNIEKAFGERRQTVLFHDLFRNDAVYVRPFQGFPDGVADDFLGEGAFQGIDGHDPFQTIVFIQLFESGIDEGDLSVFVLHPSVEKIFARFEFVPHIRLIEPDDGERQPVLITVRLDGL